MSLDDLLDELFNDDSDHEVIEEKWISLYVNGDPYRTHLREQEIVVLYCLSKGYTPKEIATRLDKSYNTVLSQIKSARFVLRGETATHAVAKAIRRGDIYLMKAIRLADDVMPAHPGEWSLQHGMYRPPYGEREEVFMMTPLGNLGALIPENHAWAITDDDLITVSPSIVYFEYHGYVQNGVWT